MSAKSETLELEIEGLCCTECAMSVDKALARVPGVENYELQFSTEKAIVRFFPDQVKPVEIEQAIEAVGYPIHKRKLVQTKQPPQIVEGQEDSQPTSKAEIVVDGLCCTECAMSVETTFKRLKGIRDYELMFTSEKAMVSFDSTQVTLDQIKKAIHDVGYQVKQITVIQGHQLAANPAVSCANAGCACDGPSKTIPEKKTDLSVPHKAKKSLNTVRFWFIAFISLVVLGELVGESMGWLDELTELVPSWLLLVSTLVGGYPIFRRAFLGLRAKQANVDQMMTTGIVAALVVGQWVSALLLVFFMSIAHYLEGYTVNQVRQAIRHLVALVPTTARVIRADQETEVLVEQVGLGEVVRVRPGERIPVDGTVVGGKAVVNQATITGESLPVEKSEGDGVYAGTIAERGFLDIHMEKAGEQSVLGQIIHLVERAEAQKSPIQRFADRFTAWFLPSVLVIAVITYFASGQILYAVAVLVAACPCAVGLATPLSVVSSVGSAARRGLLIKGGLTLETLARVDTLVVDKTGTLTYGEPQVMNIYSEGEYDQEMLLHFASSLEQYSEHPLAGAILKAANQSGVVQSDVENFVGMPGMGISGTFHDETLILGNRRWLIENQIELPRKVLDEAEVLEEKGHTVMFLAKGGTCIGFISVVDPVRPSVHETLQELHRLGIRKVILLSGDNARVVEAVAKQLDIHEIRAECLPADKIQVVQSLQAEGHTVAVVGDGVNDAPSLVQADVGIAMGLVGSDIATESADVVLMRDDWEQVIDAIVIGRRTARTIRQNIGIGIGWNVMTMSLAAFGIIGPVLAAASEAIPDVFVALNSSRLYQKSPKNRDFKQTEIKQSAFY